MTAGGCLSPLLAAVMLIPLDEAMNRLWRRYGLFYVRYMDDFVILAPTRHLLRRAIKEVHAVMARLRLHLHNTKRCIGKLSNGFDFLGYRVVPGRKLRTSAEGRRRFAEKFAGFTSRGPTTVASGGMRSVGVAGKEPGWMDWCRLKEDYEGS